MASNKLAYIVTTGMLASTLIFSMGTGSAFANGEETGPSESAVTSTETTTTTDTNEMAGEEISTETEQVENSGDEADTVTEEVETATEETNSTSDEQVAEDKDETAPTTTEVSEEQEVDEPSLVPGDFFYFVKIMTEKIRLAFTADDYKEAKLLAEFSAERIAEANVLFADGKADEAAELLKEAIATQEKASEELTNSDETSEVEDNPSDEESSEKVEVPAERKLAHNIDALLMALENVKNPTAQQALMKNIQKSFDKLDKRLGKLEEKDAKLANKMQVMKKKLATEELPENQASLGKVTPDKKIKKDKIESEEVAADGSQQTFELETVQTDLEKDAKEGQTEAAKAEVKQLEAASKGPAKSQAAAAKMEAKQQEASERVKAKQQEAATKEKQAIVPNKPEPKTQDTSTNTAAKENGKGNEKGNH